MLHSLHKHWNSSIVFSPLYLYYFKWRVVPANLGIQVDETILYNGNIHQYKLYSHNSHDIHASTSISSCAGGEDYMELFRVYNLKTKKCRSRIISYYPKKVN
jgi:hypothetical protein